MLKKLCVSICFLFCFSVYGQCALAQNVVTDWAGIVQPAITNPTPPFRSPATSEILHTVVQLAMYDAAMAIEGGYRPYAATISAPPGADVRAAVATAAYLTARARVASLQVSYLDGQYQIYMSSIPDGQPKTDGIQVGESAAAAVLGVRTNDGFDNVVQYQCSSNPPLPGEFEPNGGCGTQPLDPQVAQIMPFTFSDPSQFRTDGPNPLNSLEYTEDFIETRDYGRSNSTFRTPEQTDTAYFWSEQAYIFWNRNLIALVISRGLNIRETARFLAMVHTAGSDAFIAGFNTKYFYRSWRPRTAIPRADTDGNPDTDPDPTWTPLLTVNHPEYPSAHGFYSTAITDTVARYFGTNKVTWTLVCTVPQVINKQRTYSDVNSIMREVDDARVWAGLHWRHSMHHGDQLGRKVAKYVIDNFFRPVP